MHEYTFRRATAADASLVRDITRAAYAKWVPVIGREPKPMTADYDKAVANHVIDLLEESGRPIALIEMIPAPDHLLIENIAVLPEHHNTGLGGILLERSNTIAQSLNLTELRLYTNGKFTSNIDFYALRGFEIFQRDVLPALGEVVHMKKPLDP
jgi:N-acetylglutamate synthase-like GNAT family acetyltransferase